MLRVVFFILVVLSLGGCRTVRPSVQNVHTVKDSTWTVIKYHQKDTTITIPGDVSYISLPISQITEKPTTKTSGRSTASVKRSGDNIEVQCECVEFKQKISYLEAEITHLQKIVDLQKQITVEPYAYIPWYIKILAWIGGAASLGFALLIAKKLFLK